MHEAQSSFFDVSRQLLEQWRLAADDTQLYLTSCKSMLQQLHVEAAMFSSERDAVNAELRRIQGVVSDASTLCRIVQARESKPVLVPETDEQEAEQVNVSVSMTPTRDAGLPLVASGNAAPRSSVFRMPYEAMMSEVVPAGREPLMCDAEVPSPQVRPPHLDGGEQHRKSNVPNLRDTLQPTEEDELVVLLLRRQLQRREAELKRMMKDESFSVV